MVQPHSKFVCVSSMLKMNISSHLKCYVIASVLEDWRGIAMSFINVSWFFIFQKMKISYISIDVT